MCRQQEVTGGADSTAAEAVGAKEVEARGVSCVSGRLDSTDEWRGTGRGAALVDADLTGAADAADTSVSAGRCAKPRTLT